MGRNKEGTVCNGKAINDMPRGWYGESEYNKRVYEIWRSMIRRCYSEKYHEKQPTYKNCYCCERWLRLSNFVEDVKLIPNYNLWLSGLSEKRNPYQLDKDIKSDGQNKCYCLEQCIFVDSRENSRQAVKYRDNSFTQKFERNKKLSEQKGELVARFKENILIDIKHQFEYKKMGYNQGNISACCRWYQCGEDINEWHKIRKDKPVKIYKGYIWKYLSDCTPEQLNEYYESH